GAGSCGTLEDPKTLTVAINAGQMGNGANPNDNPTCNKTMTIKFENKSIQAKITDTCISCQPGEIVLSYSAAVALGTFDAKSGRAPVTWS
ncbi:hypothetical protein BJ085DRAFT_2109, partial [Dimargaris cristalligena]